MGNFKTRAHILEIFEKHRSALKRAAILSGAPGLTLGHESEKNCLSIEIRRFLMPVLKI